MLCCCAGVQELGVADAAAALNTSKPVVKRQKKAKAAVSEDSSLERRVSSRERKAVNYCEMEARTAREPKAPVDYSERIKVRGSPCCCTCQSLMGSLLLRTYMLRRTMLSCCLVHERNPCRP